MLAAAGRVPLLQRRQDADCHVHAGAAVADRRQHEGRRVVREAGDAHRAAHRLRHRLVAFEMGVRAVAAEALDRGVDQPRVDVAQHVPAEAQPVHGARPKILQQDIGLFDDFLEQPFPLLGFQVEGQALLVGVEQEEEQAVGARLFEVHGARHVAGLRLLELDHVGAEKCQHLGAGRSGLVVRHVDDADAGQGLAHSNGSCSINGGWRPSLTPERRRHQGSRQSKRNSSSPSGAK